MACEAHRTQRTGEICHVRGSPRAKKARARSGSCPGAQGAHRLRKQLKHGESAGYNRAYIAERPVWIATLPAGHADGLPRAASKGGRVRIGGALYPIIASVSASHTIVEIGDNPRVRIGDEATLFDWTEGSRPEDLSGGGLRRIGGRPDDAPESAAAETRSCTLNAERRCLTFRAACYRAILLSTKATRADVREWPDHYRQPLAMQA